ncbi:MAG: radical SAM protein [Thermodesulfobacteriota bacterium]
MRVLLISANREEINMATWPLGTNLVAEAARAAGYETRVLDLMHCDDPDEELRDTIREFEPRVLGVSVRNIDDQSMEGTQFFVDQVRPVVDVCRSVSEAPIVLGGAGYSIFPQSCLEYLAADMGIQGEGEMAFTALLASLERKDDLGGIPGLHLPGRTAQETRVFPRNLDEFPLPRPSACLISRYTPGEFWLPVQTRRGCPMDCSYCSTGTIEGRLLRKRAPARVVQWLSDWVKEGVRRFHFVDNTFNLPKSYAREVCDRIVEAGLDITWRCIVYPSTIDETLVRAMSRAGCSEVALGFESGSEAMLNSFHKHFAPGDVRRAAELFAAHGVRRMGFLLLGGPGETRQSVVESLDFADSLKLDLVKLTVGIRIYPYTTLARQAVEDGMVTADDNLLQPRFYLTSGLDDWLRATVAHWISTRRNWVR